MTNHTLSPRKIAVTLFVGLLAALVFVGLRPAGAQEAKTPKPLIISQPKETMEERLNRKIALDVRDMNVVDVLKFLAMKGEFNVVISPSVDGRTTVLLDNVAIQDALDIVVISNRLAYSIQNNIIQIMNAVEYEAMFGKQFSDKTVVVTLRLQYVKPSYILAALDNIKSNVGKIIIDEDTGAVVLIDTPQSIEKMKKIIAEIEQPLETVVYNLQYARADVVADKLRSKIDAKSVGSITADERSNQLMVRVFPGRKDEVEKIIRHLDEPTKEVLVEARILQVMIKPTYNFGIDWTLASSEKDNPSVEFKNLYLNNPSSAVTENLTRTFGQIGVARFNFDEFQMRIAAMEQVSDTKILSNPKIIAVNNEESRIHIGDTIPYIISTVSGTGDNAITSEDVRFIDVGLKLNVTPIINDDGMITMRLRPEISSVVDKIESQGGGIPQVNKTEVETTLMVEDGTTIILAGLRKDDKTHLKRGVPVLMHIPYLAKFFSSDSDSVSSSEIVIFITPHILSGKESYKAQVGTVKPSKAYNK